MHSHYISTVLCDVVHIGDGLKAAFSLILMLNFGQLLHSNIQLKHCQCFFAAVFVLI